MKILMIYPEYPPTFWSFRYALSFINKKASLPPLGLLTISSMLPEKWKKRLVDMNVQKLKDKDILWADYVFVSGMIVQKDSAQQVIYRAKSLGKIVVAGGPLFTTGYKDFEGIDHLVLNEAESTLAAFIQDILDGTPKKIYTSQERPDVTKTPVPDWKLLKKHKYASLAIQISRGCPFNCEFCDVIIMNGRVPRLKSSEQVIGELDAMYSAGWRGSVFVVDDNFIGNKAKVKVILKDIAVWMKKRRRPFTLFTEASINLADEPELIELMQQSNFNSVFVGIETPDNESLMSCGKIQNINIDMNEKIKILQRNGLQVQGGFIVGFDTDTNKTFDNMINFIQKSGIVTAMVGLLTALPETKLYNRLHEAGRLIKKSTGSNTDFSLNFLPKMDAKELIEGYKKVLNSIFSPENYSKRIITFLKEYKRFAKKTKMSFRVKFNAVIQVVWKLGIREKGKRHFWKLFFWTLFKKPVLLSEALTLAIYGFHYRTVMANNYGKI